MSTGYRLPAAAIREYDIRGVVGRDLDADDAHAIGRSFATRLRRAGGRRVAVGRDGRLSSPMLEAALVAGLIASGADVVRIGIGPSPMLYFAEATLAVDGGIQVTGSHNPADHNGFKFVAQRRSFFGDDLQDLARLAAAGDWLAGAGTVSEVDITDAYVDRLMQGHSGGAYRIAWDCGSGAAGPAVEKLIALLPGDHVTFATEVDGCFPHHHPDPTVEANLADLKRLVLAGGLDFGVAFDGDGDRIGVVDSRGRMISADRLLAILVEPVLAALPGATIVADVKAGDALFDRVRALGGVPLMWKTGHSLMKTKMLEVGAPIAGEMSGHIFFAHDFYGHDDALFAAVRLISALHASGRSLAAWLDAMPATVDTPDLRLPVDPVRKLAIVGEVLARVEATGVTVDRTDGVRVTTADGWWLLRASNTQDMITIRAEARDRAALDRLLAEVDAQLAASGVARH